MNLEIRKYNFADTDVIFYTDTPLFRDAILAHGGQVVTQYYTKGKEIAWDVKLVETKKDEVIKICKTMKNNIETNVKNG